MSISRLMDFISSERLDVNLFRGESRDFNTGQVFGGQVLGQAIKAAYSTLEDDRFIHSAHAYFLLRGDVDAPIIYEVDRSLDGGSFSSRRVVAIQHGRQIFHLSASFQKPEQGLEHYSKGVPPIDALHAALEAKIPEQHTFQADFFDVHFLPDDKVTCENGLQFWIKAKEPLPDDIQSHHSVLGYCSDLGLLAAVLVPHNSMNHDMETRHAKFLLASLDHAIWFHRPFRADEWLFYDARVQSTSGGRGLAYGKIYSKDGTLVASTSQEGLMRLRREAN